VPKTWLVFGLALGVCVSRPLALSYEPVPLSPNLVARKRHVPGHYLTHVIGAGSWRV